MEASALASTEQLATAKPRVWGKWGVPVSGIVPGHTSPVAQGSGWGAHQGLKHSVKWAGLKRCRLPPLDVLGAGEEDAEKPGSTYRTRFLSPFPKDQQQGVCDVSF